MAVDAYIVWPDSRRWVSLGKMLDCWSDWKTRNALRAALEYRQDFLVVREDSDLFPRAPKTHGCINWHAMADQGWSEGPPWEPPTEPEVKG